MSNYDHGNETKIKFKFKDKNYFLNNYNHQKGQNSRYNQLGKLVKYPFLSSDRNKKIILKSKNIIKDDKDIDQNQVKNMLPNILNNDKSEKDLHSYYSEKELYGTLQNNVKRPTPKKLFNNLSNSKSSSEKNYQNQVFKLKKDEIIYNNFFEKNNYQNPNYKPLSKISSQTYDILFSRSSKKQNSKRKKKSSQDNKFNDSFSKENKLISSSNFPIKMNFKEEAKLKSINVYNSDDFEQNNNINDNKTTFTFHISKYGAYTMAGTNAFGHQKTNQDSFLLKEESASDKKVYTFGVFDGHGLQGHLVSEGIKNYLSNCNYEQYTSKQKILSLFISLSKYIESSKSFDIFCSGSTAVVVHVTKEKIICANCGDSRAILIKDNGIGKLSRDHKPELNDEKKRIIAAGGRVDRIYGLGPFRVWFKDADYPGLAMSRSIGDTLAHRIGVSNVPEIIEFNIQKSQPIGIILASDGVWEFMTNEQVKNIFMKYKDNHNALACAKEIVEKSRQIWRGTSFAIDDITCVVAFFNKK